MDALRFSNFSFGVIQTICFLLASVVYLVTAILIGKIEQSSQIDKNERTLRRSKLFVWVFFSTCAFLGVACGLRQYTLGLLNAFTYLCQVVIKGSYLMIKAELFIALVYWTFEIRLTTQVLRSGQILIIGFDSFQREVLRFYMNHESTTNKSQSEYTTLNSSTVKES